MTRKQLIHEIATRFRKRALEDLRALNEGRLPEFLRLGAGFLEIRVLLPLADWKAAQRLPAKDIIEALGLRPHGVTFVIGNIRRPNEIVFVCSQDDVERLVDKE